MRRHNPIESQLVVLLGLHRTLSSAVAHALSLMGMDVGTTLTSGEDPFIARLCEEVYPYCSVVPRHPADVIHGQLKLWAERRLARASGPLLVKYPTLALMLTELRLAWPGTIRYVRLERPIHESICSVISRNARIAKMRHLERAGVIKNQHTLYEKIDRACADAADAISVSIYALLANPRAELEKLARQLGLQYGRRELRAAAATIAPAQARHTDMQNARRDLAWINETTICITTHEQPAVARHAVATVKAHYPGARILVMDDSRNPVPRRDVQWRSVPADAGLSVMRNTAVTLANTPLVLLMDDDQEIMPWTNVARMYEAMQEHGLDVVAGCTQSRGHDFIAATFQQEGATVYIVNEPRKMFNDGTVLVEYAPNFLLARREALRSKDCLWKPELKVGEHLTWAFQAKRNGLRLGIAPGVFFRDGQVSRSSAYKKDRSRSARLGRPSLLAALAEIGATSLVQTCGKQRKIV